MRIIFFILIILSLFACSKSKTVLICGDHICINNDEAKQYFEDNLTLEVRVLDKKKKKEIDLVELNLKTNMDGKKEIAVIQSDKTKKKLKILSNDEIEKKKSELKKRDKEKKKKLKKDKSYKQVKLKKDKKKDDKEINIVKTKKNVNKSTQRYKDICAILQKCSIEEISKYLVKQGKKKKFPDITIREN